MNTALNSGHEFVLQYTTCMSLLYYQSPLSAALSNIDSTRNTFFFLAQGNMAMGRAEEHSGSELLLSEG